MVLQSQLVKIDTCFIQDKKEKYSVLWDDRLSEQGLPKRAQYFYFGRVNDEEGIIQLPASVFFAMNDTERLLKKDKRSYQWVIGKTGSGLETKYNTVKDEPIKTDEKLIKENTDKLCKTLTSYERRLSEKLSEFLTGDVFKQADESLEEPV